MNFFEAISSGHSKHVTFKGRASRSEFWWFYLFLYLLSAAIGYLAGLISPGLTIAVSVGFAVPQLSVGCRRLHDIGRSGWWQLLFLTVIGIILLIVWWASKGVEADNAHGSKPAK